jgi:hypothetical protein
MRVLCRIRPSRLQMGTLQLVCLSTFTPHYHTLHLTPAQTTLSYLTSTTGALNDGQFTKEEKEKEKEEEEEEEEVPPQQEEAVSLAEETFEKRARRPPLICIAPGPPAVFHRHQLQDQEGDGPTRG